RHPARNEIPAQAEPRPSSVNTRCPARGGNFSLDKVGNYSDTTTYLFYANGPKTPDKPGDLNGDGNADLWAVDQAGALFPFFGAGDGTVTKAAFRSNDLNLTGAKISHRGDWTHDGYEDLISLRNDAGTKRLWMHPNNGTGYACTDCDTGEQAQELGVYDPANNHWSNADQILAIGDVDGPLDVDEDGTIDVAGYPDLLIKQGDLLWLYYGSRDFRLDSYREPILIGPDGWEDHDLFAPGDTNNDGRVDLGSRNRTTGELFVHRGAGPDGDGLADQSTQIRVGTNFSATGVPMITSPSNFDSNPGGFDVWFTRSDNALWSYNDLGTGTGALTKVSDGWTGYQAIS
ncbi:VCBS repeat-containing protein, partial [Streptomyces sp. NPDC087894]